MMGLKVLQKNSAKIICNCLKRTKDLQQASSAAQITCHENEHLVGPEITAFCRHRLESEGVPEPVESLEHILAHVIGSNKVFFQISD